VPELFFGLNSRFQMPPRIAYSGLSGCPHALAEYIRN
jgi:hypothetical protein